MKKALALFFALIFILGLSGCERKTYELPWDHFCYYANGGAAVELEPEEKRYIIDLLNSGEWYGEIAKCAADFNFSAQRQSLGYSLEDGIFNDFTRGKSLKISEKDRIIINGYLSD